jgi:hypothetical protein
MAEEEPSPEERVFLADVARLTRSPHRQAGSPGGVDAAAYIAERLKAIGVQQVHPLDMPIWRLVTERCELEVAGRRVPLHPLRPNVVVPPVTPPAGIKGPLVYAGRGRLEDYGKRFPEGALVVLDYDSQDAWERAFALGASAVIFLGGERDTAYAPKSTGVPSNQVRLYASRAELGDLDLTHDEPEATLFSRVVWQRARGRNLVARIPGTDPGFSPERSEPEALVVGVPFDSFGVVPELARGARGAANVAAALELAQSALRTPPKRDLLFVFTDNDSHGHQGARELYASLQMPRSEAERLATQHQSELTHVQAMRDVLEAQGLEFDLGEREAVPGVGLARWLTLTLENHTDHARDDVRKELEVARLAARADSSDRVRELDREWRRWDELRRALHEGTLRDFVAGARARSATGGPEAAEARRYLELFGDVRTRALDSFARRITELADELRSDEQRAELKRSLGFGGGDDATWIVLHAELALSGDAPTWGVVAGDWSALQFAWRAPKPEGDAPGYYGRVLNVVRGLETSRLAPSLDLDTLSDPSLGFTFAGDPFVTSASVAGSYGVYNIALLTGYDRRPRDGHPSDTLEHLNWRRLRAQAREGGRVLLALASEAGLSLPRVFAPLAKSKYPGWNQGRATGEYAGLSVSGSLSEDRPASGALMALWPGEQDWKRHAWDSLRFAPALPGFDPLVLEPVDQNGRFRVVGVRSDLFDELMALGTIFDVDGQVAAVTTTEKQMQRLVESMRVNLFYARAGKWTLIHSGEPAPRAERLSLLKASSDSLFRDNRALWGQLGNNGFFYISDQIVDYRIKLFQPAGDVALGTFGPGRPFGDGLDPARFAQGLDLGSVTARDLWQLNESRLGKLRARGVTSADLEQLHGRAKRALEQAGAAETVAQRQAALGAATALGERVYQPLRDTMDDLVHAIVILLLLTIPFAFSLERLLIGATTVYGRIAGFAAVFLATFAVLFWLHPGFAIAATPIIIFLAFAILLLSSLVIYIVVRKFKAELREMQGQSAGQHEIEVSRMGTLLAAVGMGMSTMRRRPTRTFLTATTVVILTFTILSFASFQRNVGVRSVYEGPASEQTAPDILIRKLDYSSLPLALADTLSGSEGEGGLLASHYWLVRERSEAPRFSVTSLASGKSLAIDAVMGTAPAELTRWPELERALGAGSLDDKRRALDGGGVYLPPIVQDVLQLAAGERVLINGAELSFAGTLDGSALQRIKQLDGQSLLPVDFVAANSSQGQSTQQNQASESERMLAEGADRAFVHLSSDQVAIASPEVVRRIGGSLYAVTLHAGGGVDVAERARRLAEVLVMPVWARGSEGVERLVLTRLTDVSGGLALFVPLLLGGLIIFGTLLGSINDREKEIYTFSALGLSPVHVGVLFFAEAAVYAFVGGVGGQLLAQAVGLGASWLSAAGQIEPVSLNYSSTNALFATAVVMLTVLVSAIYPALRASRSANPGLVRSWTMPEARGDLLSLTFPFTVSAYDITGVVSFLAEHFRRHDDVGLGSFAASGVTIGRSDTGHLVLSSDLALAPFDLGVTQHLRLTAVPSEIEGVDEVAIDVTRQSGASGDWQRQNRVFMRELRRQFLVWRTLSSEAIEAYRRETLAALGPGDAAPQPHEREAGAPAAPAEG